MDGQSGAQTSSMDFYTLFAILEAWKKYFKNLTADFEWQQLLDLKV